ncbi:MAG: class I SAM-dependent methyltransferase [Actinomycetota bacterium]
MGERTGDVQYVLAFPSPGQHIEGAFVPVRGWVFHPDGVEQIQARTGRAVAPVMQRFRRDDVSAALLGHPRGYHTGFYLEVDRSIWSGSCELWIQTTLGEWVKFKDLDVTLKDDVFERAQENLLSVLVCATCHFPLARGQSRCESCSRPVEWLGEVPSFLGAVASPVARGDDVSRHEIMEEVVPSYFELDSGGMFLDAGAGWPPLSHPRVIQLEIERFPSTNVVADGAQLPFREATFDGIISHAVMEHVKDPFGYAKELIRVLKPGSRVLCHSAFLQPLHGYPHHYFNTSLEGLKTLFKGVKIIEEGVAPFQQPWLTLEWVLRSYVAGFTDEQQREKFKKTRIVDLLGDMDQHRPLRQFQQLRPQSVAELAAGVYILGER